MNESRITAPRSPAVREEESAETPLPTVIPAPRRSHWLRRLALWGIGAAVLVGLWWMVGGGLGQDRRDALPDSEGMETDPSRVLVTAEPVAMRPVQRGVAATGTLYGFEEVIISAKLEGRVRHVVRDFADRVKPGELLLEIDPTDYELAVRQAEKGLQAELARLGLKALPAKEFDPSKVPAVIQAAAKLENARLRLDRARRLAGEGAFSTEELADRTADYRTSQSEHESQLLLARAGFVTAQAKKAALDIAEQQQRDTRVLAPIPTHSIPNVSEMPTYAIAHRSVAEGSFVRVGTELFRLVFDQTLKLRATVPERHDREVKVGQPVEIRTALSSHAATGKVVRISPVVDPATRTFEVEIDIPNPHGELKPGSFARAAIQTRLDGAATTVPLTAVTTFAGVTKIFVIENDRVKEVPVTLGEQTTEWVEIAQPPLPRDAVVVTSGQTQLADGTAIRVRKPQSKEPSPPTTPR
jgi:RND family efflux transporter MFP subunit